MTHAAAERGRARAITNALMCQALTKKRKKKQKHTSETL